MSVNRPDWEALYRETIYAVSHDLGAPIRHVRSFSQHLLEENPGLDGESKKWLSYIQNAGEESQAMLDGLLRLSRIFSGQSRQSVVSAESIASSLDLKICGPLNDAHVCGNIEDLNTAFNELVDNANIYSELRERRLSISGKALILTAITPSQRISDADWPTAQRPLTRLNARRCAEHIGMGLPIAAGLVSQMNGTLLNTTNGVALQLPLA